MAQSAGSGGNAYQPSGRSTSPGTSFPSLSATHTFAFLTGSRSRTGSPGGTKIVRTLPHPLAQTITKAITTRTIFNRVCERFLDCIGQNLRKDGSALGQYGTDEAPHNGGQLRHEHTLLHI